MQWYYASGGKQVGPISESELQRLISKGTIRADTLVWNNTMSDWTKYGDVTNPPSNPAAVSPQIPPNKKSSCSQCGKTFSHDDMIRYENSWVCASCKPIFMQKLKEGLNVGGIIEYAGFWIRFVAIFIDGLILMVLQLITFFPLSALMMSRFDRAFSNKNTPDFSAMAPLFVFWGLLVLLNFSIQIAYETWFVGKYAATPGKMACRIKVINADGTRVSYLKAFGRYFGKFISYITLYIGFIIAAFDQEKRALHDHICETRVVKKQ